MFPVPVLNEGSTPTISFENEETFLACKEIDKIGNAENLLSKLQVHLRFITQVDCFEF